MKNANSPLEFSQLFDKVPKIKGKMIGNPPKVMQMPYNPRKETKKK